ncbi:hypothetical protein G7048_23075 [Diaphorobacter sp. HDW4B]|uniref:hypothetical protein n=1 Tax=Diaphorobacter sp. HDW4B TaxID=2714925 RepID=UPI00140B405B|nr:hypothetical protein [Diaphorobacter sp. HDW4B]QIL72977.1 hypothetical protein G7048_23075 [Diaphorobacter sp. HDW4B]
MSACLRNSVAALLAGGLMQVASAQWVVSSGAAFDLAGGAADLACLPVDISGTYSLSGGSAANAGPLTIAAGGVLNAQGQMLLGADFNNLGTLNAANGAVTLNGACVAAGASISVGGTAVFNDLTISSTSGQTFSFQPGTSITVNGNLTVSGTPGAPVALVSASGVPITILLGPGARVTQSNVTLTNIIIGATVTPPASTTPVPVLDNLLVSILSLMVFVLSFGALRGRRSSNLQRKQP